MWARRCHIQKRQTLPLGVFSFLLVLLLRFSGSQFVLVVLLLGLALALLGFLLSGDLFPGRFSVTSGADLSVRAPTQEPGKVWSSIPAAAKPDDSPTVAISSQRYTYSRCSGTSVRSTLGGVAAPI